MPLRRRSTWTVIAVAIVVLLVGAGSYLLGRGTGHSTASASGAPSSAAAGASTTEATPEPVDSLGAAPTGCLGGPGRTAAMVLAAQRQAPHTAYGAVDVAAAFFRWGDRFPFPSSAESDEVSHALIAPKASSALKDIATSYATAGDITHGEVAANTPFYLSTVSGMWLASGTPNRVLVTVNANYVVDGQLSPTKTAAAAAVMVWTSRGWHVLSEQRPDVSALANGGTQFTGGC